MEVRGYPGKYAFTRIHVGTFQQKTIFNATALRKSYPKYNKEYG
jgi:hypothetical protein